MDEHSYGMNRVALDPPRGHHVAAGRAGRAEVLGLAAHGGAYLLVCGGLLITNLLTSPAYLWALWPLFGWGIGVASHAASILGLGAPFGRCHKHGAARPSSPSMAPWMGGGCMPGASWSRPGRATNGRDAAPHRLRPRRRPIEL